MTEAGKGVAAMIAAACIWGFSPIFYKALSDVPALEVFSHRTLWSLVFFGLVLGFQGRLGEMGRALTRRNTLPVLALSALMIAANWYLFIWAVQAGRATEASMGYYIYPLLAVVMGRVLFGERLARAQWLAVALAVGAVGLLTFGSGNPPLMALTLATTFSLYGLIKKRLVLGPVLSVTCEVLLIAPVWSAVLLQGYHAGTSHFAQDPLTTLLLVCAGPVTALPLILFSYAARRLAMATVGLLQYINPTLQFACAILLFGEPFGAWQLAAFALIWTGLALYSVSALRQDSARRRAAMAPPASGTAL